MQIPFYARFDVAGIVIERRELTSQRNKSWRGYVIKVGTIGQTIELTVEAEQYAQVGDGEQKRFLGVIKFEGDRTRLTVQVIKDIETGPQMPKSPAKGGAS